MPVLADFEIIFHFVYCCKYADPNGAFARLPSVAVFQQVKEMCYMIELKFEIFRTVTPAMFLMEWRR